MFVFAFERDNSLELYLLKIYRTRIGTWHIMTNEHEKSVKYSSFLTEAYNRNSFIIIGTEYITSKAQNYLKEIISLAEKKKCKCNRLMKMWMHSLSNSHKKNIANEIRESSKKCEVIGFRIRLFWFFPFWRLATSHVVTSQSYDTTYDLFWLDDESTCEATIQKQTSGLNRRLHIIARRFY